MLPYNGDRERKGLAQVVLGRDLLGREHLVWVAGPVSYMDGPLAIDNKRAVKNNTGSTHYGVHIAAVAGSSVWLRCWDNQDDCNLTGWSNLGSGLAGPISLSNVDAQIRLVASDNWNIPRQLWHKWRG